MLLELRDMEARDALACAELAADSEIGLRYGFKPLELAKKLILAMERGDELFLAEEDGTLLGFAWVDPRGAFSSAPYLRLIAVNHALRGRGVGARLLEEFEARTASVGRDYCLLVSDFNTRAQAFYESKGYAKVGQLKDFAVGGIAEIIMVKPRPRKLS